jgi:hypothetical protein
MERGAQLNKSRVRGALLTLTSLPPQVCAFQAAFQAQVRKRPRDTTIPRGTRATNIRLVSELQKIKKMPYLLISTSRQCRFYIIIVSETPIRLLHAFFHVLHQALFTTKLRLYP